MEIAPLDTPNAFKRHVHYGVEDHHFDSVGEALIDALHAMLGAGFTSDVQAAWLEAYTLVASVMRRALIRTATPPIAETDHEPGGSPALTRTS